MEPGHKANLINLSVMIHDQLNAQGKLRFTPGDPTGILRNEGSADNV